MYYSIYTSDENDIFYMYQNLINKNTKKNIQENLCLICWSKNEPIDQLYSIKDFNQYFVSCNCQVLMHSDCLTQWVQQTNSCPICRKAIAINYIYLNYNTEDWFKMLKYYVNAYNYTFSLLKLATIISFLNFIWLLTFNFYVHYNLKYEPFKGYNL